MFLFERGQLPEQYRIVLHPMDQHLHLGPRTVLACGETGTVSFGAGERGFCHSLDSFGISMLRTREATIIGDRSLVSTSSQFGMMVAM